MSLLMDALKRAEQAREARERDGQSAEAAPTRRSAIPELSLDPVDLNSINSALTLEPVGAESTLELTIGDPGVPDDSATGISMLKLPENTPEPGESSDGLSFRLSAEGTLNSEDPLAALEDSYAARENSIGRIEESPTRSEDSVDPLSMALGAQDIEVQDTSATLPSLKAVRASVNSYFDGTDSVSISMESVPPELVSANTSTTITGRRLGEEVEAAQKAAQRVFDSKLPPSPSTGRTGRTLAFVILPIVLVLLGTAGVFIWVTNASAPSVAVRADGGSPSLMDTLLSFIDPAPVQFSPRRPTPTGYPVASAPALTVAAVPADASLGRQAVGGRPEPSNAELVRRANQALADGTATIAARGPGSELIPGMPVPEQADLSVRPPEPKIVEAPALASAASPEQPQGLIGAPPIGQGPTSAAAATPSQAPRSPSSAAQATTAVKQFDSRLPTAAPASGTIKIAINSKVDNVSPALTRAYSAYQAGQLPAAGSIYRQVLRDFPKQRDALLGAAAVAGRAGRVREAQGLYERLLTLNPRDSAARTGLLALRPQDPRRVESELKTLLSAEPDAAHLHYSLGNLYAADERWPEAQAAYFQAFRHDTLNPDYAFNLAVALDHMQQSSTALDYYRQAVLLAGARDAGFDLAIAQVRVNAMQADN